MKFKIITANIMIVMCMLTSCIPNFDFLKSETTDWLSEIEVATAPSVKNVEEILVEKVYIDFSDKYATYSIINDGFATLYKYNEEYVYGENEKSTDFINNHKYTVAVNAGHGTKNASRILTFSHPDFSPKVTGGTNAKGQIVSSAVSDGTVLKDDISEAEVNLKVAMYLKDKLLEDGYNVLMIRVDDDVRLDNIARTVIANNNADIHIAIHFDSTETDKGAFYMYPYNDPLYRNMEPVKSNIGNIKTLGESLLEGLKNANVKIWKKGVLQMDLTQLSYSTNASVDIELGDKKTDISEESLSIFAEGIKKGVDIYFQKNLEKINKIR